MEVRRLLLSVWRHELLLLAGAGILHIIVCRHC